MKKSGGVRIRLGIIFLVLPALVFTGGCSEEPSFPSFTVETPFTGLNLPVTLAFAPDGRLFFNELNTGRVRVIENGQLLAQPFAELPVLTSGERGLIGLAFDPNFNINGYVYLLHHLADPTVRARIVRFTDFENQGIGLAVIVDDLPSTSIHNGGNIGFGPDGMLYVTVGDGQDPANSQNMDSVNGKILRYVPNGSIPASNPYGSFRAAYNLGLRNSFDFDFHPLTGTIYASENGPDCDDEINRIVPGANYGWRPNYPCGDTDILFVTPIIRFTPVIAPTGITFYTGSPFPQFQGDLFMVDFNNGQVQRFAVDEPQLGVISESAVLVDGDFGALFDIVEGPDGFIYFSSSDAIHRLVP